MLKHMGAIIVAALAAGPALAQGERSGEQIVKQQCAQCHQTGVSGAPKIDDRQAWIPRMKNGLDATVRSAIRGHGAMPARGGMADLTDRELRSAILYMFYPAGSVAKPEALPARPAPSDPHHKLVDGTDIYLGISPLDARGNYHVNVSLREHGSNAEIGDAAVEARVANALSGTTKTLAARTINQTVSYGNSFSMAGREPYTITVKVQRPKEQRPVEARFDFRP